jgi:hypothetical protein
MKGLMPEGRTPPETAIVKMETATIPVGYAEHAPPLDLAAQVVCFWTARADTAAATPPNRVLPDGCVDIILGFGSTDDPGSNDLREAFAVGAMTKPLFVAGPRPHLYIAVRFKPGFAFAALGVPAADMTDDRVCRKCRTVCAMPFAAS